ncbi:MAG: FAD-binding protein [Chloroflexota bacterium]|nr:FAD-binding protein [Chloroflexota bacterium]
MGLNELGAFAVDGRVPAEHVDARREEDVVEAIRDANARRVALVLWGGGTRIGIGDAPARYDVALDLRGLRGVVDHQPGDLTVTVRAGTTLAELSAALAAHRQWWPVEAAHPERATVGGTIASAADGPSRYRYLHVRDHVIGVHAVLGDGTLTRAGGRVVKNVTGYDLSRLYSGTFGTLCAIVEATLKLTPLPERSETLIAESGDRASAVRLARDLVRLRLPLDALAVASGSPARALGSSAAHAVLVRLAGNAAAVERLRRELASRAPVTREVDATVWQVLADAPADADVSLRATWPPALAMDVDAGDAVLYVGLETAHLLAPLDARRIAELRAGAERREGALVVERAPSELRRSVGTWGTPRVPAAVAQRLRDAFDPNGVLAPGRVP